MADRVDNASAAAGRPHLQRREGETFDNMHHHGSGFMMHGYELTGNVGGGGGYYGPNQGHMPTLHPGLPESIWVLDPLTRKLKVPINLIIPTAATATLGTTPSLCLAFLENRCRHPWCRQAHIPIHVVQRLRVEAQNAPNCCHEHKSPQDISFLTSRFKSIDVTFHGGNRISIPATRLAVTVGLQRHLAQVVPKSKTGPSFEVSSRMVCRLHLGHRCRYLEDCNNLHVCREYEPVQNAFAEMGPERSPLASGQPVQAPSSTHSTPVATGTPAPPSPAVSGAAPPRYGEQPTQSQQNQPNSHQQADRSPPFGPGNMVPPSPLVSPANSYSPNPGTPSANPYVPPTNLPSVTAATQGPINFGGRMYNLQILRSAPVTDNEFASMIDAHTTMFGASGGKLETIDLCRPTGTLTDKSQQPHGSSQQATPHAHGTSPGGRPATTMLGDNVTGAGQFMGLPPPADSRRWGERRAADDDQWSNNTTPQRARSAQVRGDAQGEGQSPARLETTNVSDGLAALDLGMPIAAEANSRR